MHTYKDKFQQKKLRGFATFIYRKANKAFLVIPQYIWLWKRGRGSASAIVDAERASKRQRSPAVLNNYDISLDNNFQLHLNE